MPQLHEAVDRIINSGRYAVRPHVEGFTEHELKNSAGEVVRKVTKADLDEFARVNNEKATAGALTPIGPGHTFDDQFDDAGNLTKKFPEDQQPKPFGYLLNYRVELNPHTNKYSLFHDEYIQRLVEDPEHPGQYIDGLRYSESFPRRSAEAYHKEHWIDWMAAIRRAPRLDLGIVNYAKSSPDKAFYARTHDEADEPAIVNRQGKFRYSFDTGPSAAGAPPADDPTKPPSAAPAPPPANPAAPAAQEAPLPPEHMAAAEKYAMHTMGMHHTRAKALMQHMHTKYAAECGMTGDMNTPYAMGMPGPAAVVPGAHPPAAPAAAPAPAAVSQPTHPAPNPMEHSKMSVDQLAIEKERYERRLADLESRAIAAEAKELKTYYERELMQLVHEGYDIDAAAEMLTVEKRRYTRERFDEHIADIRRFAQKAPVGSLPPLSDMTRDFRIPTAGPAQTPTNTMTEDEFAKANRYQRQHPEMPWAEVKERYNKTDRNGTPAGAAK